LKIAIEKKGIQTRKDMEAIDITDEIEKAVEDSGVKKGMVLVFTMHTSSGLIVTEGLPCLEKDIIRKLEDLAPKDGDYYHNRYLDIDGRLGFNAHAHLKSVLGGISAIFPIEKGKIVKGSRQRVYFLEFDGPLYRNYCIEIMGECY